MIYLFYDGLVQHLRLETVAVSRRMKMVWMINDHDSVDKYGLNLLTFVLERRKTPGRKPQPGNLPNRGLHPGPQEKRQRHYLPATAWSSMFLHYITLFLGGSVA